MNNHLILLALILIVVIAIYPREQIGGKNEEIELVDMGCYRDDPKRFIRGKHLKFKDNTPEKCAKKCNELGFKYAATQFGAHCFCDNEPTRGFGQKRPEKECHRMVCPGDRTRRCGSGWRNNIFEIKKKSTSSPKPEPEPEPEPKPEPKLSTDVVKYIGCFQDDRERHLKGQEFQFINNTPTRCTAFCRAKGFKYAGLQGDLCFCDNEPKRGFGKRLDDKECSDPCPSDKSKKCGKSWKNRIYDTGIEGEFADAGENTDDDYISSDYIAYDMPRGTRSCYCNKPEYIQNNPKDEGINNYMGCYRETPEENLSHNAFPDGHPNLTPKRCQFACRNNGYRYAGLQFGNQCWCGNGEKGLGEQRPEWECNNPCKGDARQNCGGILRQTIYQVKG